MGLLSTEVMFSDRISIGWLHVTSVTDSAFLVTPVCIENQPELFDENAFGIDENVKIFSYSIYGEVSYPIRDEITWRAATPGTSRNCHAPTANL